MLPLSGYAQQQADSLPLRQLKQLSLEELMNLEVMSVSRRSEKLTEVASAIQVITSEAIRRSGATNLPEALRLVSNLQVAQLNSFATIISARGFNALFANKLLVMIDGRTVYSPLFAGVFWDAQSVLLEDIERIEVISGPGGTIWEANAVNGVINIITKNAADTRGLFASLGAGNFLEKQASLRYGGQLGRDFSYRVFAQHTNRGNTYAPNGEVSADQWGLSHGGLRLDWNLSGQTHLMVQGNAYGGTEETLPRATTLDGQNMLGRLSHHFSEISELNVQLYFDRTWRSMPGIRQELETYDLDIQHGLAASERHHLVYGIGYRLMEDEIKNPTTASGILPEELNLELISAFIQDEISLLPTLKITLGTKLLHNDFTGIEWQPSGRLAWSPLEHSHTFWASVSRAVRTPSRIDRDYYIPTTPVPPGAQHVAGGPNFISEKVLAYELGYRVQPGASSTLSLATFYNRYNDLYSVDALPGTLTYQIMNGTEGESWGAELSGTWQPLERWRLRGGYTYFKKDLRSKPGHSFNPVILGYDAQNQLLIHSMLNLPGNFQLDHTLRYLDELPGSVPDYFTFDMRLAWSYKWLELAAVGQNLWEEQHREWGNQMPRSYYGRLTCRF